MNRQDAELIAHPCSEIDSDDTVETIRHLQSEIAYLSKLQRRIVIAYYFENRKQADIADELGLPSGTVKWHLFEAKKELKRGMDTMRKTSELKFNPIRFHSLGVNGSLGTKSVDEFFRSALSQNICYCVRNTAKTVGEIADDLGVSPVYVETEVEFLEEYGFLLLQKNKYLINFMISEPTVELLTMQNNMYRHAAELFANELYDELVSSGILDDPDILCGQTDEPVSLTETPMADRNFILWSLIPYIAACSGEKLMNKSISFEEVATIRPDGGNNIFHASVVPDGMVLPDDYVHMGNGSGPMWNSGDYDGHFKSSWQIVVLTGYEIKDKLLAIGERIKKKNQTEFDALKAPYAEAVLESVPAHLRKVKAYELQFVFHSDGWFLLHCITELMKNGKLKEPSENQKKSISTLPLPS